MGAGVHGELWAQRALPLAVGVHGVRGHAGGAAAVLGVTGHRGTLVLGAGVHWGWGAGVHCQWALGCAGGGVHWGWVLTSAAGSLWGPQPWGAVTGLGQRPQGLGGPHPSDPPAWPKVGAGGQPCPQARPQRGLAAVPPTLPPAAATAPPVPLSPRPSVPLSLCPSIPPLTPTSDPSPAWSPHPRPSVCSPSVPLSHSPSLCPSLAVPLSCCPPSRQPPSILAPHQPPPTVPPLSPQPSLCPHSRPSVPTAVLVSLSPSMGPRCSGDRHWTPGSVSPAPPEAPPAQGQTLTRAARGARCPCHPPPDGPCTPPAMWPPGHGCCVAG